MEKIVKIQSAGADRFGNIRPVTIEVEITDGIGIHLVGMADMYVKESLLRTITALQSMGFIIPGEKTIINITPSSRERHNPNYDLPMALGILIASEQITVDKELLERCVFSGELGLDGTIRQGAPYQGYAMAMSTFSLLGQRPFCFLTCKETAMEASPITNVLTYGFTNLADLLRVLTKKESGDRFLIWNSEVWDYVMKGVEIVKGQSEYPL